MTALASNKRRLKCPSCGSITERQSRQQIYCSTRCRMRASRGFARKDGPGDGAGDLNAPAAVLCYAPPEKPNNFKAPKTAKAGWSDGIVGPRAVIGVEVIAGREWQEVVSTGGVKSYVSRLAKRALVEGDE
jgi:hypothetical protein